MATTETAAPMVDETENAQPPLKKRLLWFAALWCGSLVGFAALVYGGKWLFNLLGRIFVP